MFFLIAALAAQVAGSSPARIQNRTHIVEGITVTYGLSVPAGYKLEAPPPLILALHPGGDRIAYYGSAFARQVVMPALAHFNAIVIAPDCPVQARGWDDPAADRAVMEILEKVMAEFTVDRKRMLVTGFSMGGRGTWFMSAQHPDLFTAAIPMAASLGNLTAERLGQVPTYIIHSRDDQVVPFAPAEKNAQALEALQRPVRFEALSSIGHYEMGGYVDALRRAGRWVSERWAK